MIMTRTITMATRSRIAIEATRPCMDPPSGRIRDLSVRGIDHERAQRVDSLPAVLARRIILGEEQGMRQVPGEGHPFIQDERHAVRRVTRCVDDLSLDACR